MFQSIAYLPSQNEWRFQLVDSQFTKEVGIKWFGGGAELYNYVLIDGCAVVKCYQERKYSDTEIAVQLALFLIWQQERYGCVDFAVVLNALQKSRYQTYLSYWKQAIQQLQKLSSFR